MLKNIVFRADKKVQWINAHVAKADGLKSGENQLPQFSNPAHVCTQTHKHTHKHK